MKPHKSVENIEPEHSLIPGVVQFVHLDRSLCPGKSLLADQRRIGQAAFQ